MIHHDIEVCANAIKVSLTADEQENLSAKQQELVQLLKNTSNNVRSRRAALEQACNVFQEYQELLKGIQTFISKPAIPDERVTTLSGLLLVIQKLQNSIVEINVSSLSVLP